MKRKLMKRNQKLEDPNALIQAMEQKRRRSLDRAAIEHQQTDGGKEHTESFKAHNKTAS